MKKSDFKSMLGIRIRNKKSFYLVNLLLFIIIGLTASSSILVMNLQYPALLNQSQKDDVFHESRFISFPSGSLSQSELESFSIASLDENITGKYEGLLSYYVNIDKTIVFKVLPLSVLRDTNYAIDGKIGEAFNEVVISRKAIIPESFSISFTPESSSAEAKLQLIHLKRTGYVETVEPYIFVNDDLIDAFTNSRKTILSIKEAAVNSTAMTLYDYLLIGQDERILLPPNELKLLADIFDIEREGDTNTMIAQKLTDKKLKIYDSLNILNTGEITFGVADSDYIVLPHIFAKAIIRHSYTVAYIPCVNEGQRLLHYLDQNGIISKSSFSYLDQKPFIPQYVILIIALVLILIICLYIFMLERYQDVEKKYLNRYDGLKTVNTKIDGLRLIIGIVSSFITANAILLVLRFCFFHLGRITYITASHFIVINLLCLFVSLLVVLKATQKNKRLI